MKIKSLILAMVACAGLFTACSNEIDGADNGDNGQQSAKDAYASFSFIMPSGINTRGAANGDGFEIGTKNENELTNVAICLFKNDELVQVENKERADFSPTTTANTTVYTTKNKIQVATGEYKVYIVLNPATLDVTLNQPLSTFEQNVYAKESPKDGAYCTNVEFMMTNAEGAAEVTVDKTNTEQNAAEILVKVERIAAKITFSSTEKNNAYTAVDESATITFDAYKVINTRNSAYNFRRVGASLTDCAIGGIETGSNYVIENKWNIKSTWIDKDFNENYSRRYNTYVAFRKLNAEGEQPFAYCLENTMPQQAQMNGYSTGIIFRAKVTLKDTDKQGESGDFYKFRGIIYPSLIKLNEAFPNEDVLDIGEKEGEELAAYLKGINNPAKLHDIYSVDYFVAGTCYYKFWVRHNDNNDPTKMGIMEFAIVRNNVYKLKINTVATIGDFTSGTPGAPDPKNPEDGQPDTDPKKPNPEIPGEVVPDPEPTDPVVPIDPETPDETDKAYLNVTIEVLPWIVRNNEINL